MSRINGSYWRGIAAPIISQVIKKVGTKDQAKLKKALSDAYPFYEKRLHPYKVWRDEIKRQLIFYSHSSTNAPYPSATTVTDLPLFNQCE